jgi:hypothetical protein
MTMNNKSDWAEREKGLARLVGARLTSVQFVMNYLILGFDERGALTTLVWPEIFNENRKITFETPGYRDALCSLIQMTLQSAAMESDESISLGFENRTDIRIPLRSYEDAGERAILTGPKHYLLVF